MSLCVAVIATLQFYYSYTNYKVAEKVFKRDANEALQEAVDSAYAIRREIVIKEFVGWMGDTTFIKLSCKWNPVQKVTQFTIKEVNPLPNSSAQNTITMSVSDFAKKRDTLDKEAKEFFIAHMGGVVRDELKKGVVWFFTSGLGERLDKAYIKTPLKIELVAQQYKLALKRADIILPFSFNPKEKPKDEFVTDKVDISTSKAQRLIYASFKDTDAYLLGRLKWIIMTSVLLMFITFGCFWYTLKTLFNQEKFSRLKDDFISNMTHEIHSPLSSVMITAEAMKEFDMTKEERDSYADIIVHQSKKLSALADEILAGAKLEKKGITLEDTIDLEGLLKDVVAIYKDKAAINYSGNTAIFKGNKSHFERAITNVVDNAIKYNEGENVKVEITTRTEDNEILLSIADNGPGIPDTYKIKVFDQFYRIPTGNIHNVKGYGLGLSYVKKVIQAHKGSITIKDNNPSGSIFVIRIPYES
jgi:two-component system phosphate regulon sensor histidine kinase PhoR